MEGEEKKKNNNNNNSGSSDDPPPPYLSKDLLIKILSKLPVRSLLRFKCACKNWYNLIQSPHFIRTHLHDENRNTRLLVRHHTCLDYSHSDWRPENPCALAIFGDGTLETHEDIIDFIQGDQCFHGIHFIGPIDGLFLLRAYNTMYTGTNDHLALWNPATHEFNELPKPKFRFPIHFPRSHIVGFGFCLDPLTKEKDYKVVWIPTFRQEACSDYAATALYTLSTESWKRIKNPEVLDSVRDIWWRCTSGACEEYYGGECFLNGAFYWLVECKCGRQIASFDMGTDEFRKIPTPNDIKGASRRLNLVLHDDLIVLLEMEYKSLHMWVMDEEGCWTKRFTLALAPEHRFQLPLGFWRSHEEIFFETSANQLVLFNHRTREGKYLGVHGHSSGRFLQLYNYKESLVSVKGEQMNMDKLCDTITDFFAICYCEEDELEEEEDTIWDCEEDELEEEEEVKRTNSDRK